LRLTIALISSVTLARFQITGWLMARVQDGNAVRLASRRNSSGATHQRLPVKDSIHSRITAAQMPWTVTCEVDGGATAIATA